MPKVKVLRQADVSSIARWMLASAEVLLLCLSVTVGLAALFPGPTEWAFEHAQDFLRDPKSCRDFGWPLFALGGGLALEALVVGAVGFLLSATVRGKLWFLNPPAITVVAWLIAFTYSQPCGVGNPYPVS